MKAEPSHTSDPFVRSIHVPPDLSHLGDVRAFVREVAADAGLDVERTFDLTVAVSEAAANAIEHPAESDQVEVRAQLHPGRLSIEVWGPGYIRRALSQEGEERHRGLGLPLMASLTDELRIIGPVEGRTAVVLTVFIGGLLETELTPPTVADDYLSRQRALHRVARQVLSQSTREGLLQRVADAAAEITHSAAAHAALGRSGDARGAIAASGAVGRSLEDGGEGDSRVSTQPSTPALDEFLGEVVVQNRALALTAEELARDSRWSHLDGSDRSSSGLLGAPLVDPSGEASGAIVVLQREGDRYTAEDELLLTQLANLASLGLQHVAAREQAEGRAQDLMAVFEALPHAVSVTDSSGRVRRVNRATSELWGHDPAGTRLEDTVAEWGIRALDGSAASPEQLPTGRALKGSIVSGELIRLKRDGSERVVRAGAAPLVRKGRVVGAVTSWTDVTAEVRNHELTELLHAINLGINATSDFREILSLVADRAAPALGADRVVVQLREDDEWRTYALGEAAGDWNGEVVEDQEARLARHVHAAGEVVALERLSERPEAVGAYRRFAMGSCIAAPLELRGEVVGVVFFGYRSPTLTAGEHEIEFVRKLSASVSLAVQNARLYEEKSRIAEVLQQPLLSLVERIDGLRVGHLYRSATEAARVGGDFYDLFNLSGGRFGVVVGDVSGHGVEAAMLASLVRETVRAYAYNEPSTGRVMELTNRALIQRASFRGFTSVFFGVVDPARGDLDYCSAGHPPSVLRRFGGSVEPLAVGSPVIGALPDVAFHSGRERLRPGDVLVGYTDGVIEARRNGVLFGEERLRSVVAEEPDAELVPKRVYREVRGFTEGRLSDDLALLAVSMAK